MIIDSMRKCGNIYDITINGAHYIYPVRKYLSKALNIEEDNTRFVLYNDIVKYKAIYSHKNFCILIKDDGTVWCITDDTETDRNGIVPITTTLTQLPITNAKDIATGGHKQICILKEDGTVWYIGYYIDPTTGVMDLSSTDNIVRNWTYLTDNCVSIDCFESYGCTCLKNDYRTIYNIGSHGPKDTNITTYTHSRNIVKAIQDDGYVAFLDDIGDVYIYGYIEGIVSTCSGYKHCFSNAVNIVGFGSHSMGCLKSDGTLWTGGSISTNFTKAGTNAFSQHSSGIKSIVAVSNNKDILLLLQQTVNNELYITGEFPPPAIATRYAPSENDFIAPIPASVKDTYTSTSEYNTRNFYLNVAYSRSDSNRNVVNYVCSYIIIIQFTTYILSCILSYLILLYSEFFNIVLKYNDAY